MYFFCIFQVRTAVPMCRINMKGIIHYPIKAIHQWSYTDLVIVAKYESKKKKDKIKIVQMKT
jgi:choline kinase